MSPVLFNLLAIFTVVCALGVVLNKNTVNAAMCLLLTLVGVAALFVGLQAYLLAFILLLVYAGAVVALFLFIIMLLDTRGDERTRVPNLPLIARGVAGLLIAAGIVSFYAHGRLPAPDLATVPALGASLKLYAYQLFTTYLLPVELIGFLLLIAMLGVIVLSKRFEPVDEDKR